MARPITAAIGLLLLLAGPVAAQTRSPTLDAVVARGQLVCGVGGDIPGFSLVDGQGVMRGLDADGCRAIAAAVLGDATKVRFVPLTTVNRFTALQSGEIDLLLRNTSWTLTRESNLGLLFAATNFWDSTGFMVKASSGIKSASELNGATICVRPGTSTEIDVTDWTRNHDVKFTPVLIGDVNAIQQAFLNGRCDVYTTDSSQLAGFRYVQGSKASQLVILPETVSPAQSGSMVRKGDDAWFRHRALDPIRTGRGRNVGDYERVGRRPAVLDEPRHKALARAGRRHRQVSGLGRPVGFQRHQAGRQLRRDV